MRSRRLYQRIADRKLVCSALLFSVNVYSIEALSICGVDMC